MAIADQIKAFHDDIDDMVEEAEEKAVDKSRDNETVEYDFIDGSVLQITNDIIVSAYGSR